MSHQTTSHFCRATLTLTTVCFQMHLQRATLTSANVYFFALYACLLCSTVAFDARCWMNGHQTLGTIRVQLQQPAVTSQIDSNLLSGFKRAKTTLTTHLRRAVLVTPSNTVAPACSSASEEAQRREVVGCHAFGFGPRGLRRGKAEALSICVRSFGVGIYTTCYIA